MLRRRLIPVIAAIGLAGCTTETVYGTIPIVSAEPALPSQIRQGSERLMAVEKLYAWCDQGSFHMQVSASSATGGWSEPRLNRVGVKGATITYEAVAKPPPFGRTPASVVDLLTWRHDEPAVQGITRVRVQAQMNEMAADFQLPYTCY